MSDSNELALVPAAGGIMLASREVFDLAKERVACYRASNLIPKHLTDAGVMIALDIAARTNQNPLFVMQCMYEVHGKPGWSATYLIGRARQLGHPIGWEIEHGSKPLKGKGGRQLRDIAATAFFEDHPERRITIDMETAVADGWAMQNDKYSSMPEIMLRYRSATALVRLYLPEVLLGMPSAEELRDVIEVEPAPQLTNDAGAPTAGAAGLRAAMAQPGPEAPSDADVAVAEHQTGAVEDPEPDDSIPPVYADLLRLEAGMREVNVDPIDIRRKQGIRMIRKSTPEAKLIDLMQAHNVELAKALHPPNAHEVDRDRLVEALMKGPLDPGRAAYLCRTHGAQGTDGLNLTTMPESLVWLLKQVVDDEIAKEIDGD